MTGLQPGSGLVARAEVAKGSKEEGVWRRGGFSQAKWHFWKSQGAWAIGREH